MGDIKFTYNQFRAKSPAFTAEEVRALANVIKDDALADDGEDSGLLDLFYGVRNFWEGQTLALADREGRLLKQIETAREALKAGVIEFMGNNQCSADLGRLLNDPIESIVAVDKVQATKEMFKARISLLEQVRENLLKLADAIDRSESFANFNRAIVNAMTSF
ncbi:hypothetical protein HOD38_00310 [archaeon]|jgi:hypothetical protein|nr:hypothetical protein [archaeon]MBT4396689.1 hypothetical protein [archaeon]MBT4441299.1 hypothetical protein [archaeon]